MDIDREIHQLVFVGGVHRSGTSALYRALGTHPNVSCLSNTGVPRDEGQHLQEVYPPALEFGGPGRFGFHPRARMVEDSPLVTDENRRRLLDAWSPYWDLGKPVLVEKSPPNTIRSRFLQALFPSSSFVFIIRHPIPTALSTMQWSRTSVTSAIEHWLICHELLMEDIPSIKRHLLLKYEDFVAEPEVHASMIANLLGLENEFDMAAIRDGANKKYLRQWRRLRVPRSISRRRLSDRLNARLYGEKICSIEYSREIEDVETRYEGAINRFGYSFSNA